MRNSLRFPSAANKILWSVLVLGCALHSRVLAEESIEVRVLVQENQKTLSITVKGGYALKALPSLRVLKTSTASESFSVVATARGIKAGKEEYLVDAIRLEPAKNKDLRLGKSQFRGKLDIYKTAGAHLSAVNRIDLEEYLYGVLHHEVAAWWPMEALRAQAIAARTYAVYESRAKQSFAYDLKSSTSSQVYGGSIGERYRTKRAVDQTRGKILTYRGELFPAYFHATCAGVTAAAKELWKIDLPPLGGGVRCNFCRISPHLEWEVKVPLAEIEEIAKKNGRALGRLLDLEIISMTPSGRVGSIRMTGTGQEMQIAAKDFRVWVGGNRIRSTRFKITIEEDMAVFQGRGWGHGVGLCQWGTLGQALLGHSHEDILQFYYPGAVIQDLAGKKG